MRASPVVMMFQNSKKSGNCKNKKTRHIDSHTGVNPQPGAEQKTRKFRNGPEDVGGLS